VRPWNNSPKVATFVLVPFLPGVYNMAPATRCPSHRFEVLIGRSAALCIHPLAAWRSRSRIDRALLVIAYVGISYAIVLGLLHVGGVRL
jgi:hypothetical protein